MKNAARLNELPYTSREKEARPKASIVIPIHNEESFLYRAAFDLYNGMHKTGLAFELLLCENGSTDRTLEIANKLKDEFDHIKVLTSSAPDYGGAMRAGVLATKAPYIFVFDIDYYSIPFLEKAFSLLKKNDIVIASKLAPDSEDRRSIVRKIITHGFSLSLRMLFNTNVKETHGMKAFRRKKIKPIIKNTRMAKDLFDTELIVRAERGGLRIKEIPVAIEEKRPARSSMLKRIPRTVIGLFLLRYFLWREHLSRG